MDLYAVLTGTLSFVVAFLLGLFVDRLGRWFYKRFFLDRATRKFWGPLIRGQTTIVMSELPSNDQSERIGGLTTSLNEALAIPSIDGLALRLRHHGFQVKSCKDADLDTGNFVLLGGPINNSATKELLEFWSSQNRQVPFRFDGPGVTDVKGTPFPDIGKNDEDYAMILTCRNPYSQDDQDGIVILAGVHAPGTEAAALVATNTKLLGKLTKDFKNGGHSATLVRFKVSRGRPRHVAICNGPLSW